MGSNSWDSCPTEILCQIFRKLGTTTLLITMQVSLKWQNVAYHVITHQHGGLENVVNKRLEAGGKIYRRKSNTNSNYLYLNSLLWYNVSNSEIIGYNEAYSSSIKHLSIYKDNVIIVDITGVTYFGVDDFICRRRFNFECDSFEENDCMVVMQETKKIGGILSLKIYAKSSNVDVSFVDNPGIRLAVTTFKFHDDYCYIIKGNGEIASVVWDGNELKQKSLGRFYGTVSTIAAMQVSCNNDFLYIMLKTGTIVRCNTNHIGPLLTYLRFDLPNYVIRFPIVTFHRFGAVIEAPSTDNFNMKYYDEIDFLLIKCPGLTCATDHENVLFLGYNDGKVEIFIKRKLIKGNQVPERTINIYDYYKGPIIGSSREIRVIDVYEAMGSHILFIGTSFATVKLSIVNPNVLASTINTENIDEICLSVIHLLNIEE